MATDLINREPTLPGLVPNADVDRLAAMFTSALVLNEGPPSLPRLPNHPERQALHARQQELARALRPIREASAEQSTAERRIAVLCNGWSQNRTTDAQGLVATFLHDMLDLPLFAILAGCDDVTKGRAIFRDARGNDRVIDPAYPVSSAQLYATALKHAGALRTQEYRIRQVLGVRKVTVPPASPEVRERIAAGFKELSARLTSSSPPIDRTVEARARNDALKANQHQILLEYERMGIDQIYSSPGVLLSPALARKSGLIQEPRRAPRASQRAGCTMSERPTMLVAEIDPAELAVGMCEANYGIKRPEGLTAKQALDAMEPEVRAGWLRSAKFAAEYLARVIGEAERVN